MYEWEGQELSRASRICAERDPRRFRTALLTRGTTPEGKPAEVLQWFRNRSELAHYLWRIEPQRWGFRQATLIDLKDRTQDIIAAIEVVGLAEPVREALNKAASLAFEIHWWGTFEALKASPEATPKSLRATFHAAHADNRGGTELADDEAAPMIEFLRSRYLPPYCPPIEAPSASD